MKKKRNIVLLALVVIISLTLGAFGAYSIFTDYQIAELKAQSGVSLTLETEEGVINAKQEGYVAKKLGSDTGWYRSGDIAKISAELDEGYTFKGWYDANDDLVSDALNFEYTIIGYTILTAKAEDTEAPVLVVKTPAGTTEDAPAESDSDVYTVTGTVSDAGSSVASVIVKVGENSVTATIDDDGNWSADVTLAPGVNTITVVATDKADNEATATEYVSFDSTAPELTMEDLPEYTKDEKITIKGTVSDTNGVDSVIVKVGEDLFTAAIDGEGKWSAEVTLTEGANTITAVATDKANNTTEKTDTVVYDATAPVISFTQIPDVTNEEKIVVEGAVSDDESGVESVVINGTINATVTGNTWTAEVPLTEGSNTITAVATDNAGNTAEVSDTVTRDTTAPTLSMEDLPDYTTDENITVEGDAFAVSGVDSVIVKIGEDSFTAAIDGEGKWSADITLPEGKNIVTVIVTDKAGNTAEATDTIWYDKGEPVLTMEPLSDIVNTEKITVTGTASDTGSGLNTVTVKVGENSVTADIDDDGKWTAEVTLTEGSNTITAVATDKAGNTTEKTDTVAYDATAPILSFKQIPDVTNKEKIAVVVTASDSNGVVSVVINDSITAEYDETTDTWTAEVELTEGENTITAVATDNAGNTAEVSDTVIRDTAAPTLGIYAVDNYVNTEKITVTGAVSDTNGVESVTVKVGETSVTATINDEGKWSAEVTLTEGENTITAVATDKAGNSIEVSDSTVYDKTAPTVTVEDIPERVNTKVTVKGTVSDDNTADEDIIITVNGTNVTPDADGNWTIDVYLTEGEHTITIVATDEADNSKTVTESVICDATSPTLTMVPVADYVNTDTITVTGTVSDASGIASVIVNGSVTATVTGDTWTAVVPVTEGSNIITAIATDNVGHTISVTNTTIRDTAAPALGLYAVDDYVNTDKITVSGSVSDTGSGVDNVTVKVSDTTVDATVDAETGKWSAEVTLTEGENTITAIATDKAGNTIEVSDSTVYDKTAPVISFKQPTGTSADAPTLVGETETTYTVSGTVSDDNTLAADIAVTVNGVTVTPDADGNWSTTVILTKGETKEIKVVALDKSGNETTASRFVLIPEPILAVSNTWFANDKDVDRADVTEIEFVDSYTPTGTEGTDYVMWDVSEGNVGTVTAYLEGEKLTIAGNGTGVVYANPDSSYAFADFTNLTKISGFNVLNAGRAKNMNYMFANCTSLGTGEGEETARTVIFTEADLTGPDEDGMFGVPGIYLSAQQYVVTVDGTEYICTGVPNDGVVLLGNLGALDSSLPNTGEPFIMGSGTDIGGTLIIPLAEVTEATSLTVESTGGITVYSNDALETSGETMITAENGLNLSVSPAELAGQSFTIVWDGVTYTCPLNTELETDMAYFGNMGALDSSMENTGEPFVGVYGSMEGTPVLVILSLDGTTPHSVVITLGGGAAVSKNVVSIDMDTSGVETMDGWLSGCSGIAALNISSIDTSSVQSMKDAFAGMTALEEVTLGANFAFVGTDGYLPAQSDANITGADGNWYSVTTYKAYVPSAVPANTADTYVAVNPDAIAPNLNVTAPLGETADAPTVTGSLDITTYTVTGTVSDNKSGVVSLTVNGEEVTPENGSWSFDVDLVLEQVNEVTIVATDKAGNTTTVTRYIDANGWDVSKAQDGSVRAYADADPVNAGKYILTIKGSGDMMDWSYDPDTDFHADEYKNNITSLVIEEGVTSIGAYAFDYFRSLSGDLVIPDSVTSIGNYAFEYCSGLTSLDLGSGVQTIDSYAFYNCTNLTGELVIPGSVTKIGNSAFRWCSGLTGDLVIPGNVATVGSYAFANCSGFGDELIIEEGVKSLGYTAFYGCSNISRISVLSADTSVYGAFPEPKDPPITGADGKWYNEETGEGFTIYQVPNGAATYVAVKPDKAPVITITAPAGISADAPTVTGSMDATYTVKGTAFDINESVTVTVNGVEATLDTTKNEWTCDITVAPGVVTTVTAVVTDESGNTVTETRYVQAAWDISKNGDASVIAYAVEDPANAGKYALTVEGSGEMKGWNSGDTTAFHTAEYRTNITSLTIEEGVKSIGQNAFNDFSGLTGDLVIPDSVISIGSFAFSECSGLSSLDLGSGVQTIGEYAFIGCNGFKGNLVIPDSVTSIGEFAFYQCSGFDGTLTIGANVEIIGDDAFFKCGGFKGDLVIPDSVTSIGIAAFYKCSGLSSLDLGSSVQTIGIQAFRDCTGLVEIKIPATVTSIGDSAFPIPASGYWYNIDTGETVSADAIPIETAATYAPAVIPSLYVTAPTGFSANKPTCTESMAETYAVTGTATNAKNVTVNGKAATLNGDSWTADVSILPGEVKEVVVVAMSTTGHTDTETRYVQAAWDISQYGDGSVVAYAVENADTAGTYALTIKGSGAMTYWDQYAEDDFHAAEYKTNITSLTIEDGVTMINQMAFFEFTGLTGDLVIPDSVTTIGSAAFEGCSGLNGTLTIGSNVQTIELSAFYGCSGLTGDLVIPDSVTSIGDGAFQDCSGFDGKLTIGSGVQTIDNYAFFRCSGLTGDLLIPDTVTSIGERTFEDCSGFDGVLDIGSGVQTIGEMAFLGCSNLTGDLVIPDSVISIGARTFDNCSGFDGALIIGSGVQDISDSTFARCAGLTGDLVIPNSVTSIGNYVFNGCSGLTSVDLGSSVETIGNDAFYGCTSLAEIKIPETVTSIGLDAFPTPASGYWYNAATGEAFTADAIPTGTAATYVAVKPVPAWDISAAQDGSVMAYAYDDPENAGKYALTIKGTGVMKDWTYNTEFHEDKYRTNITSLVIEEGVTNVGSMAFADFTGLTGDLIIPHSVTSIGYNAFTGCSGFDGTLTIGSSVQTIGEQAFYGCSSLTGDLVIPDSVTSIGRMAFGSCSGFDGTLTIGSSVQTIEEDTFHFCSGLTGDLVIPDSVTSIGEAAFGYCSGLTSVDLGSSVETIGNDAFYGCTSLAEIKIPETVTSIGLDAFPSSASGYWYNVETGEAFTASTIPTGTAATYVAVKPVIIPTLTVTAPTGTTADAPTIAESMDSFTVTGTATNAATVTVNGEAATISGEDWTCDITLTPGEVTEVVVVATSSTNGTATETRYVQAAWDVSASQDGSVVAYAVEDAQNAGKYALTVKGTGDMKGWTSSDTTGFYAAEYKTNITSLTIEEGVKSIGDHAFYGFTGLTGDLVIPDSVTSIGGYAFYNCSGLNGTLSIGDGVQTIGDWAFYGCSGLSGDIIIPDSVTSIGKYAFRGLLGNIDCVTISNSLVSIGEGVFYGSSGIKSFVIPESVTTIGFGTFGYCTGLTSVTIPDSVTSIGEAAFRGCSGLTSLEIPTSVASIGFYAFDSCSGLTGTLEIPNSVKSIGKYAFQHCTGLSGVVIPDSITCIAEGTFYSCTGLKEVVIPDSVTSIEKMAFYYCYQLSKATFENPYGWYVTSTQGASSGTTVDLSYEYESENARLLWAQHCGEYWYRSDTTATALSDTPDVVLPDGVTAGEAQSITAMPDAAQLNTAASDAAPDNTVLYGWLVDSGMAKAIVLPEDLEATLADVYGVDPAWTMTLTPLYQASQESAEENTSEADGSTGNIDSTADSGTEISFDLQGGEVTG